MHYVENVFRYLRQTISNGITYWRQKPQIHLFLQQSKAPILYHQINTEPPNQHYNLTRSVDSDWASDTRERKSVSGITMFLAGGVVNYKTKIQCDIAHSYTEAEFVAACEAVKMAIYLRSILAETGLSQEEATMIYEDNTGALLIANTQKSTRRSRHMDIKHFAIQDWVERDMIVLEYLKTDHNSAGSLTKPLARTAFHMLSDFIMGRIPPKYYEGQLNSTYDNSTEILRLLCVQFSDYSLMLPPKFGGGGGGCTV